MKNQIFISYRVKESLETARQICDYLTSIKYVVFFDEKSARSGRFDISIENAVEECKDFILILTPNLFAEEKDVDWVQKEISLGRLCLFTFLQEREDGYGETVAKVNEDLPTG